MNLKILYGSLFAGVVFSFIFVLAFFANWNIIFCLIGAGVLAYPSFFAGRNIGEEMQRKRNIQVSR